MIANRLETRSAFDEVQRRFGERIEALVHAGQVRGTISAALPAAHVAFMLGSQLAGISIEIAADSAEEADPRALRNDLVGLLRRTLSA